ncbi:hypothetical protein HPB52_014177 [Rhipicephalus sanguineus]|uniref:Transposase Tc1-like domain-containing protein n=1 Tax=Rhipicephalus sanguineus TaxID=34632 RepID=A0A9D4T2H6_RHISA|nr:hypothetical protein HPB52_014177 [Rhipicephalus sanguineus]
MPSRVPIEERWRIVRLCIEGVPQREICRRTSRSRTSVGRIIRAYRDEDGRIADAQRSGRPRLTTLEEDERIVAAAVVDPFLNARDIRDALDLTCSCETIRSRMREAGLMNCVTAQKPHLTTKQMEERLNFARAFEHWTAEEWREVIFTDESAFSTRWDQQQRVWRPLNSRYPGHIHSVLSSGRCSVSVWGAISRDSLGPLVRIEGPFTGQSTAKFLSTT